MGLKAVLSDRIYLANTDGLLEVLEKGLRHEIMPKFVPSGQKPTPVVILDLVRIGGCFSIPIGRTDLIPDGYEIVDKRICDEVAHPAVKADVTLRDSQKKIIEQISTNCIINLPTSFGKTFTALHAIKGIGLKTLVIVHTSALRDQWEKEYKFLFNKQCGIIGGGKDTSDDFPTSIGTIQTIRNKDSKWLNKFGCLICDETHRAPSKTFSETINRSKALYKIGMSATIKRKDGLHVLLGDYIGIPVLTVDDSSNALTPTVLIVNSNIKIPKHKDWATRVTLLMNDPDYIQILYDMISIHLSKGRNILTVASRIEILTMLHEELENSLLLVGDTDSRAEKITNARNYNPILGSMQILSEGISINHLDTLIIGTPMNNRYLLEQLVGRIVRKAENKLQPLIIDITFSCNTGINQAKERMDFYTEREYKIHTVQ